VAACEAALKDFFESKKSRVSRRLLEAAAAQHEALAVAMLHDVVPRCRSSRSDFLRVEALALLAALLRPAKARLGCISETNRMHLLVLFGMQNRTLGPYLTAINRIFISAINRILKGACVVQPNAAHLSMRGPAREGSRDRQIDERWRQTGRQACGWMGPIHLNWIERLARA
jgi:hypothetical protein